MRYAVFALVLVFSASPASAQLPGGIGKRLGQAQEARAKVQKLSDLHIGEKEERSIGQNISDQLVERFGVYQDQAVTKYVTLVGTLVAQASSRPGLAWQFIVLDTDGVNAYAAPGGFIHITRGALGLIRNEAELAGVLGHEITHITEKHTIGAIQKAKGIELTTNEVGGSGLTAEGLRKLSAVGYSVVFENKFDRGDEMESDKVGIQISNTVGYAPNGMIGFLNKLADRNKDQKEPNGLFATHPQLKDRVASMEKTIRDSRLTSTATVAARYTVTIKFGAKPATAIAMDIPGVRGAAADSGQKTASSKEEPPKEKKSGGKLGGLSGLAKLTGGSQQQSSQTVASAGSRGVGPDRDAVGGTNTTRIRITLTAAEIAAFKKGIA
jgi:predicted Zn-dependent protease